MGLYHILTPAEAEQIKKEEMQKIVLSALSKAGFFDEAVFYGGTCLRLIYGLDRFSEDMDFSLLEKNPNFSLEKYFPAISSEFKMRGREIEIKKKEKQSFEKVQSAFLKDNTDVYDLKFQTEKTPKIKIETDFLPPLNFKTETKALTGDEQIAVHTMTLPCLFAGKMHALLYRGWKTRVKGRDWYDFEWYINNQIPLDFEHFKTRVKEFNNSDIDKDTFRVILLNKINEVSFDAAKEDVRPFIKDPSKLEHWTKDYFRELSKKITFQKNLSQNIENIPTRKKSFGPKL